MPLHRKQLHDTEMIILDFDTIACTTNNNTSDIKRK